MTTLATISGCVISAGQSLSNAIDCSGSIRIARVMMPSQWDNADLTFQVSPSGTDWHDLHNITRPGDAYRSFEAVVFKPMAGSSITVPAEFGIDVTWLRVRSGTAIVPVIQSADRAFSFVCEFPDRVPAPARRARGAAGKTGYLRLGRDRDGSTVAIWRSSSGGIAVTPPGPT
jgi:hypothetical protein